MLVNGLDVVRTVAEELATAPFQSAPPDSFDWDRFFRIQSAYLLLWAVIERYAALAFGPDLDPVTKVARLSQTAAFTACVADLVTGRRELFDSRDPSTKYILSPDKPESAARYYYAVRSNLSHRGKGAFGDGEIVRHSLVELTKIVSRLIEDTRRQASRDVSG